MVSRAVEKSIFSDIMKWLHKATGRSKRLHHIFRGEVRKERSVWTAQGLHHRYLAHDMPDRRVGPHLDETIEGTYTARVSMKGPGGAWVEKKTISSFFPDHWTPQRVKQTIDEAFSRGTPVPGTSGRRWRGEAGGIPIKGSYSLSGNDWDSAWPEV
jgi:hypothetical protein